MRRPAILLLSIGLGCTQPPPQAQPPAAAAAPERKMTDQGRTALGLLADDRTPEAERIKAAKQLGELADPATVVPMIVISEAELPEALEEEITKALERIGATKVLLEDLERGDEPMRARAPGLLARLRDPAAVPPLMKALSDASAKVREEAAGALGILGADGAEAALIERLKLDTAPDVRGAAAQSLGALGSETAKLGLRAAQGSEKDEFVRVLIDQAIAAAEAH